VIIPALFLNFCCSAIPTSCYIFFISCIFQEGLTETALASLQVVLTKHFFACMHQLSWVLHVRVFGWSTLRLKSFIIANSV